VSAFVLVLPDGARLHVRPIEPGDKPAVLDAFERLGALGRHQRFLAPVRTLAPAQLRFFTEVDHHDHEALIARAWPTCEVVGVARYVRRDGDEAAEFAIAVVAEWQRRGAGRAMLDLLVARARAEGVARMTGSYLADNRAVPALVRRYGPLRRHLVDGAVLEFDVELEPPAPLACRGK
jgi:GNAT superfamily N-acetyltransferase